MLTEYVLVHQIQDNAAQLLGTAHAEHPGHGGYTLQLQMSIAEERQSHDL